MSVGKCQVLVKLGREESAWLRSLGEYEHLFTTELTLKETVGSRIMREEVQGSGRGELSPGARHTEFVRERGPRSFLK